MRQLEGPVFVEALDHSPVLVPGLDKIPPQPQFAEARSLVVGPHARLVGYEHELFRNPVLTFEPAQRVEDVELRSRVRSLRMDCVA